MHVKNAQRLDDSRLAEVLNERGMAEQDDIREMLQAAHDGGTPFCEAVVLANLVSDWDMSRVVAELFQLPFLPVDICKPDAALWEELDSPLLRENAVVPLGRFGQLLTVAMPGLVNADVLGRLAAETKYFLLPVVGTVETNRRWVEEHTAPDATSGEQGRGDWGALFDEGDAAVQASMGEDAEGEGLAELEFATGDDGNASGSLEPPSLIDMGAADEGEDVSAAAPFELPPLPDFES